MARGFFAAHSRCTTKTIANCSPVYFVVPAQAGTHGSEDSSLAPGPRFRGGGGKHHVAQQRDREQNRWPTPTLTLPRKRGREGRGPARLVGATTLRVRPTPERPLSPWVISTVSQRREAIAAAAWRTWIMNEQPPSAIPVDPFGVQAQIVRDRHRRLSGGQPTLKASSWVVGACRVDVEIDDFDTILRLVVAVTGMPRSIAETDVSYLREPEATPLTSGQQTLLALAAKLIGERFLFPL